MARFAVKATDLFDSGGNRVATVHDSGVFDAAGNKIATLRHPEIRDADGRLVARLRGDDILDAGERKIATIDDVYRDVESNLCGVALVGLWLFFIRKSAPATPNSATASAKKSRSGIWNAIGQLLGLTHSREPRS